MPIGQRSGIANRHHHLAPGGLSQRPQSFVFSHAVRLDPRPLERHRQFWLAREIPAEQIDRMIAFEERWGGFVPPPAPAYGGGPVVFGADAREGSADEGRRFEADDQRTSVPNSFMIGPNDEFGIHGTAQTPLHASVEGWAEAAALAHHAALFAKTITRSRGAEVDALDLTGFDQVPDVRGLSDSWWKGPNSYIAIFRGRTNAMPHGQNTPRRGTTALVYSDLPERT